MNARADGGMRPLTFFVVWNVALYLTALAYVHDARGESAAATGTVLLVAAVLVPVFSRGRHRRA